MDDEHVQFRAGSDPFGQVQWVAGLVTEREDRSDGLWLKVLPVYSESDEDARWVRQADVRGSVGA
ncbi:MAG TPA: hypothetical protein VEX15_13665 [Nocardioidaceae bacterium]|nr:hypothetical protein [Nocardioidaceae bacterium]